MKKTILDSRLFESIPYEAIDDNHPQGTPQGDNSIEVVEAIEEAPPKEENPISQLMVHLTRVMLLYGIHLLKKKADDLVDDLQRQQHFRTVRRNMQAERKKEYWRQRNTGRGKSPTSKKKVTVTVEIND